MKNTLDHRQGKSPLKKPPQAPPKEGLGEAFFSVGFYTTGAFFRLIQGINRSVIRQSIILIVKLMSFKTSVLIWFSRSRGTASPPANGVGLLCETEEHGI